MSEISNRQRFKADVSNSNNVPPEVLEKILGNLKGKDLLNCRLVNSQWKQLLGPIMEQNVLFSSTACNTQYEDRPRLIPKLWINVNPKNLDETTAARWLREHLDSKGINKHYKKLETLLYPQEIGRKSGNPFPSNSLRFGININEHTKLYTKSWVNREIHPFFNTYGHFITVFVLDGYWESAQEFVKLISHLPNLISLKFQSADIFMGKALTWNECVLPPLAKLTHLEFASNGSSLWGGLDKEAFLWILDRYSEQLVGLFAAIPFLNNDYPFPRRNDEERIKLPNLQQLKIYLHGMSIFKLVDAVKLTHIHVDVDPHADGLDFTTTLQFIDAYSESLVYLWQPSKIGNVKEVNEKVVFPKLKTLAVRYTDAASKTRVIKNIIRSKFPGLEKLVFVFYYGKIPDITRSIERMKYWKVCSNLKTISVYDDRRGDDWVNGELTSKTGNKVPDQRRT